MTAEQKRRILCGAIITISWASTYLYAPTLSTYAASLGASGAMIGAISGGFGLTLMLGRMCSGVLSDFLGKSRGIIVAGMAAAFVSPLGMMAFPSPRNLALFRILSGVNAAIWPVLLTLAVSCYPKDQTQRAVSNCNLLNALGNISGMLFGGWLAEKLSQNAAFFAAAMLGLIGMLLALRLPEVHRPGRASRSASAVLQIIKDRQLVFQAIITMIFQIVITGTAMTFTPMLGKTLGASETELGFLSVLSMLGMLLAALTSVNLTKWLGNAVYAASAGMLLLAVTTAGMVFTKSLSVLYVLQLLQGLGGYSVMIILMAKSMSAYDAARRNTASGIFQSIFAFGMLIGPVASGALYERMTISELYVILAGISGITALVTFAVSRHAQLESQKKRLTIKSQDPISG